MTAAVSDTTISDKVRIIFDFIVFSLFYETSGKSVYSYLSVISLVIRGTDSDTGLPVGLACFPSPNTHQQRVNSIQYARDAPKSSGHHLSPSLSLSSFSYYPALILCFLCLL